MSAFMNGYSGSFEVDRALPLDAADELLPPSDLARHHESDTPPTPRRGRLRRALMAGAALAVLAGAVPGRIDARDFKVALDQATAVQTSRTVSVDHLVIETRRSFADVKAALERTVPQLDPKFLKRLVSGDLPAGTDALEGGAELTIFSTRDFGDLLAATGKRRNTIQYEIGNPFTAAKMLPYELFAGMYAPLRVILYENDQGGATFEYDRPSSVFGQTGNAGMLALARVLDAALERALLRAAND